MANQSGKAGQSNIWAYTAGLPELPALYRLLYRQYRLQHSSELAALTANAILLAQSIAEGELYCEEASLFRTLRLYFSLNDLQDVLLDVSQALPTGFPAEIAELCQNEALPGFCKLDGNNRKPGQAAYFWYWQEAQQWCFSLARLGNLQMGLAQKLRIRGGPTPKAQSLENGLSPAPSLLEQPQRLNDALKIIDEKPIFRHPELKSCLEKLWHKRLLLISGGPGSGKTTLLSHLLQILRKAEQLPGPPPRPLEVSLCAPTARAAQRMKESLHQTAIAPEVQTLHKLLGLGFSSVRFYRNATQNGTNYRSAKIARLARLDILVIDEASMLDSEMAWNLLSRLAPQTRLILIGDPDQLPPIGLGTFWRDLLGAIKTDMQDSLVCLKGSHRSNSQIQNLAAHVLHGERQKFCATLEEAYSRLDSQKPKIIHWYEGVRSAPGLPGKDLLDYLWRQWDNAGKRQFPDIHLQHGEVLAQSCAQISGYFGLLEECSILSPLRRGPWGAHAINQLLLQYGESRARFFHACPLQITRNNYALRLFNGDRGFCFCFGNEYYGVFEAPEQEKLVQGEVRLNQYRLLPLLQLTDCEPSFVQTIHKSQGSEYRKVCVLLPEPVLLQNTPENTRNPWSQPLLYTAITRAKQEICFIGSRAALQLAIQAIAKNETQNELPCTNCVEIR